MKASIISSLGLAAAVSAQSSAPWTTSTVYATSVYTITSCAATVTDCPARLGSVTTDIISLYTTICPVTATETGAPYPTSTAGGYPTGTGASNGTVPSYPVSTYAPSYPSKSTTTIYECDTSSEVPTYPASSEVAPTYPASSEAAPTYPASSEAAPTYPASSEAAPTYPASTYSPAPIISTATISTCIPTYTTSVVTVYPTSTPAPIYTPSGTAPAGTGASSGAIYPTTAITPFTGGAAAKQAGGLLMVAGIAAALL